MTRLLPLADCRNWRDVLCMALCYALVLGPILLILLPWRLS